MGWLTQDQRLAGEIPSLQSTDPNRLSKHVVLDESVSLHRSQKSQVATAVREADALRAERDDLLTEVNRWRTGAGIETRQPMDSEASPSIQNDGRDPLEGHIGSDFERTQQQDLMDLNLMTQNTGADTMTGNGNMWDDLGMAMPMAEPLIDLDGLDIETLGPETYELPLLRHDSSFGMPFQSTMPNPGAFLQHDHIHNT